MKKLVKFIILSFLSTSALAACSKEDVEKAAENIAVTSVSLDETYKVLDIDDSFQLSPTVTLKEGKEDAKFDVQWITSNSGVADVNKDGLVTAITAGSATVSFIAGFKMASCSIYVKGADEGEGGVTPTPTPTPEPGPDPTPTPTPTPTPDPGDDEEDEDKNCTVYFFIDYNNIDEVDATGTKLLAKFKWYVDKPISESGLVPKNPTQAMDPAFPNFIGWSNHTIIDSKDDLWDVEHDVIGNGYYFYLYGIWSDKSAQEFVK